MGLTIHYQMVAPQAQNLDDARKLIEQLRAFALSLDFQECSEVQCIEHFDNPIFASFFSYLQPYKYDDGTESFLQVPPLHLVQFTVKQEGAETAVFGLARYSDTGLDIRDESIRRPSGIGEGYRTSRFCNTQFASLSNAGGWDNFFKIHDGICRILDHAKALGLDVHVCDEGGYWESREVPALKEEVARWNGLVAAVTGHLRDSKGRDAVASPITDTPEFDHLEAAGEELFREKLNQINPDDFSANP